MKPTILPLAIKASAMSIDEALPALVGARPALTATLYVCKWYRQMAVGFLLMLGTPGQLFEHLFKSGRCFLYFLEANDDGPKATSKAAPLFDAIACNDREGAALLAARSRGHWNPDLEYEDDFLYVHFLLQRFFLGAGPDALAATLRRYEEVLEGHKDFRLGLCKALLGRDQAGFDAAVEALVDALEAHYAAQRGREVLDPDEAATTVHVSTELLAWLRLAADAGLATLPSYPMAPDVARGTPRSFPAPDAWKVVERYTDIL